MPDHNLSIVAGAKGHTLECRLEAEEGPVRSTTMTFAADPADVPTAVPYGRIREL